MYHNLNIKLKTVLCSTYLCRVGLQFHQTTRMIASDRNPIKRYSKLSPTLERFRKWIPQWWSIMYHNLNTKLETVLCSTLILVVLVSSFLRLRRWLLVMGIQLKGIQSYRQCWQLFVFVLSLVLFSSFTRLCNYLLDEGNMCHTIQYDCTV